MTNPGEQFEFFCKSILETLGYEVEFTSTHVNEPDGGWDLNAYRSGLHPKPARYKRPQHFAIQCKDTKHIRIHEISETAIKVRLFHDRNNRPITKLILMCSHLISEKKKIDLEDAASLNHVLLEVWDGQYLADLEKRIFGLQERYNPFFKSNLTKSAVTAVKPRHFYNIPSAESFIDREEECKEIANFLNSHDLIQLIGTPGVGKSTLARFNAERIAENFDGVLGINIRSQISSFELIVRILDFFKAYGIFKNSIENVVFTASIRQRIAILHECLRQGRFLIIFDNFEDVLDRDGRFKSTDLGNFFRVLFSQPVTSRFLITSRTEISSDQFSAAMHRISPIYIESLPEGILCKLPGTETLSDSFPYDGQFVNKLPRKLQTPLIIYMLSKLAKLNMKSEIDELLDVHSHEEFADKFVKLSLAQLSEDEVRLLGYCALSLRPLSNKELTSLDYSFNDLEKLESMGLLKVDIGEELVHVHPIVSTAVANVIPTDLNRSINTSLAKTFHSQGTAHFTYNRPVHHFTLRIAFDHYINADEHETAAQIAIQIATYALAISDSEYLYSVLHILESKSLKPETKAWLEKIRGHIHDFEGEYHLALDCYKQMLSLAKVAKSLKAEAAALNGIGTSYRRMRKLSEARTAYESSLKIRESVKDKIELGKIYNNLGILFFLESNIDKAIDYLTQAKRLREETNDSFRLSTTLYSLALCYLQISDFPKGLNILIEALGIKKKIGDITGRFWCDLSISWCFMYLADFTKAEQHIEDAKENCWLFADGYVTSSVSVTEIAFSYCKNEPLKNILPKLRGLKPMMSGMGLETEAVDQLIDGLRSGTVVNQRQAIDRLFSIYLQLRK